MGPNNTIRNDANEMSEPRPVRAPGFANGSTDGGNDVVFQDVPKKNHGMLYGMILLAILAAGGIGFGVWAMLDGNSRVQKKEEQFKELNSRIDLLEQEKKDLESQVESLSTLNSNGNTSVSDEDYIYLDELGIKLRKTDAFPDMTAKKGDTEYLVRYMIKRASEIQDTASAPDSVSLIKVSTCDPGELTMGFGTLLNVDGDCYAMSEILPYGSDAEHPLTDFLKYVSNQENYSKI